MYRGNGSGSFAAGSDVETGTTNATNSTSLGDLDGDGDLDLIAGNYNQVNRVYLNSGNKDGTLTASATLDESSAIALPSTATTSGAAVDLFDFTLTDAGGGDGFALIASQVVVNTSGTGPFSQVTWLLNGPDASNVSGTYNSGTNKITFTGLSISVANGTNETYILRGYYSSNTSLTDAATFSFSIDGDTDLTTSNLGSSLSGSNAALSNAVAAQVGVTATLLAFTTQPAPLSLTSGTPLDLTTDPVVSLKDAAGNLDLTATTVTLAENGTGSASLGNNSVSSSSGLATFSGVLLTYTATADQQTFGLVASASGLTSATSNSLTADVVATKLAFTTQPSPLALTSGTPLDFTTDPVVAAQDANGVTDTGFSSAVTLSETGAGSSSLGNNTATAASGLATFTGLLLDYTATADQQSLALTASASGLTSATSSSLTADVVATKLVFTTQPSPLALTSGTPLDFTTDPVITAQDANGLTDTGFSSTVTLSESGAGTSSFSNNAVTPTSGLATFSGLLLTYNALDASSIALSASASGLTSATSSSFAVTAFPLVANNRGARTGEGGTVLLSSDLLQFTDAASTTAQIIYTLGTAPTVGTLQKSGTVLSTGATFTQDDIDNSRISYVHAGDEIFGDGFSFSVAGSAGLSTSSFSFGLAIDMDNDRPFIDVKQTLILQEGEQITITNGSLRVLDADALSEQVVYTLVDAPAHGRLSLGAFTQADIDERRLTYRHDGGESTSDAFSFTVSDGSGGQLGTQTLSMRIAPVNDAPVLPVFDAPHGAEGQLLVLELGATDPEGAAIEMTVSGLPEGALLDGTTFTWLPTYAQAGTYPLAVVYDDGQGGRSRLRFDLGVAEVPAPVLQSIPALVDFGEVAAGERAEAAFVLYNPTALTLQVERFTSSDRAFAIVQPTSPMELAPKARMECLVRFKATVGKVGIQQAVLTGATELGSIRVAVAGRSLWSGLEAEEAAVDFGVRTVGAEPWRRLRVVNPGNVPVEVSAQLPDGSPFCIEPSALVLAGGQEADLRVYYAPQEVGVVEQTLVLMGAAATGEAAVEDIAIEEAAGTDTAVERAASEGVLSKDSAVEEAVGTDTAVQVLLRGQALAPKEGRVTIDFNLAPGNQQQRRLGDVRPGNVVQLQLHVQRVRQIAGWSARISYDSEVLTYVEESFLPGAFLPKLISLEQLGVGYVEIGGDVLGQADPATGSGVLGTLSFRVQEGFSERAELAVTRLTWHRAGSGGPARDIVYAPVQLTREAAAVVQAGDFDGSGQTDLDDFFLFADQFQQEVPPEGSPFDLNNDGVVDLADFFRFADRFGQVGE